MVYSGQEDAELGPVDLSRLVREMLALLKVSISKRGPRYAFRERPAGCEETPRNYAK
jgi:hypothetical protein